MDCSSLYLGNSVVVNKDVLLKIISRLANCIDPDETVHYEPSPLDLQYLRRYLDRSTGLKGFNFLLRTHAM